MSKLNKTLLIILIIIIPLIILLANFKLTAFNFNFYEKEFIKYNVYENENLKEYSKEDINKATKELIFYLGAVYSSNNKNLTTNFFDEKEKLHLVDVKSMIQVITFGLTSLLSIFFLILFYLIYKKDVKAISNSFIFGSILSLIFILILFFIILANFSNAFDKFHIVTFSNNLYLLNPEVDNLINLFPIEFFYDITKRIFINSIITSIILLIFGVILKIKKEKFIKMYFLSKL